MRKIKIIINGEIIKDDFGEDLRLVRKVEIDTELEDIIPNVTINCTNKIKDYNITQNQIVEVFDENKRIFYGNIMEIKDNSSELTIEAGMETMNLLRKKVNRIYTDNEEHEGKNELIVKDLIERAGLTANVVTPSVPNIISEFKCVQAMIFERITSLMKAIDYQLRYDPVNRIVHYEPRGFIENNKIIKPRGLAEWRTVTDGLINDLRIDGATTETQISESGQIGTDENWTASSIKLSKTPNIVELIIDGVQKIGGSKDSSTDNDYWVDREQKTIYPKQGTTFELKNATINYSWSAPAPVQDFRQDSIDKYGLFQEVFNFSDISSVADAEARIEQLLDARSEPFYTVTLKTDESLEVGEMVIVEDTINNKTEKLVVSSIKRTYPSGFDEVKLGNKEWKLEDDIVEIENRIKRLEENFIRNDDLVSQLVRLQDEENLPTERFMKVEERNIGGDIMIYGNSNFGIWGEFKWGNEANQSFILGKSKLGLNGLGSVSSEYKLKSLTSYGDFFEDFRDNEFIDLDNTTATINGLATFNDDELESKIITFKEKEIKECRVYSDHTGDLKFYVDNGFGYEEADTIHKFQNTGNSLKYKVTGTGQLNWLNIKY